MLSGFCPARLDYCSAVWCSAADTDHELLDSAVSGARFPDGVFECDIAYRRSVVVLHVYAVHDHVLPNAPS